MNTKKYILEQRRIMRRMREVSMGVYHGCEMPEPSLRMLKSRYRAAVKLSDLAAELKNNISEQRNQRD